MKGEPTRRDFVRLSLASATGAALATNLHAAETQNQQGKQKMLKLGLIGSDNSHADVYAALANTEAGYNGKHIEGVKITHIYGTDAERTQQVAKNGLIPNIVTKAEEMIGAVDGVLCVWRHGAKHMEALPFIEAGIPAFIDKPLATSIEDATRLIDAAEKAKVGFTSFSSLRYDPALKEFLSTLKETTGDLTAGSSTGPAEVGSEYGGIFFYGIHTVEMMNAVWGTGCTSVYATEHNKNVVAVCKMAGGALVTLELLGNADHSFHVTPIGTKGWKTFKIEGTDFYPASMQVFVDCIRTGKWPLTRDELLEPVRILAAIQTSLKENREVPL